MKKKIVIFAVAAASVIWGALLMFEPGSLYASSDSDGSFIKWAEFDIPNTALGRACDYDISTYGSDNHIDWIELLSLLGTKYGGKWSRYRASDMTALAEEMKAGERSKYYDSEYYSYYHQVYTCVLDEFLGEYDLVLVNDDGMPKVSSKYGVKAFSPIANGFSYSHYDDFGNSRSYGYTRRHLGNDLLGRIGTPITAVESGIVEAAGWNMYGGWRIGIRSYDGKRYYYYAHMRKDSPFHADIIEGCHVTAGDVIGYLGMTGYSTKENVNNISTPHLHFGMQLIFDESQKEGSGEIWIDVYEIVKFLERHRCDVSQNPETNQYNRVYQFFEK